MIPKGASIVFGTLCVLSNFKSMPTAISDILVLTPRISRSQLEQAPLIHPLMTEMMPKKLVAAHARPAAPWFPRTNDSAAVEPMSVNKAVNSTRLLPMLMDGILKVVELELVDMVLTRTAYFLSPLY
jgi:hypothetical protein